MPAQRGKDLLLKIDDGDGGWTTVAGLRARALVLNADAVDVTHAESAGRWRELLEGAGVRRASVSGAGIFTDSVSDETVRGVFFGGAIRSWQVIVPDFGVIEGPFQISSLEYRADHAGNAGMHWRARDHGYIGANGATVMISGTRAFSTAFADCETASLIRANSVSFTGSATGKRYQVSTSAVIQTNGGGASFLPGNAAGTAATGGQYV